MKICFSIFLLIISYVKGKFNSHPTSMATIEHFEDPQQLLDKHPSAKLVARTEIHADLNPINVKLWLQHKLPAEFCDCPDFESMITPVLLNRIIIDNIDHIPASAIKHIFDRYSSPPQRQEHTPTETHSVVEREDKQRNRRKRDKDKGKQRKRERKNQFHGTHQHFTNFGDLQF